MANQENMKKLSDEQLEQVAGGTVYDAKCGNCGETIGGCGDYSRSWAESKVSKYNSRGCPNCGAKQFYLISAESTAELFSM